VETYWVWEYGLFEKNPKRQDSLNPETTLEVVKAADTQATIAALQARVNGLEKDSELLRQSRDDFRVKYESVKNDAITLQSQLTQCTAELEAANKLLYKKNCELGRFETIISNLQAELERVRGLVKALPKVEGAVVVSNGYVKDSTRCHALFGADEDAALYAALLQHRHGMEG